MKNLTLCLLACCSVAASAWAQDVPVNREKYPDYVDPAKAYSPEPRLMKYVNMQGQSESRSMMRKAAADELPDHWNNADTKYFPPVFNQAGGSCGSASRIGYMFTHEINSLRDVSGSLPENQYSTHFVWLFTSGNDGKDQFVEYIGVPNSVVYGGRTYSQLFGYQEETNNDFGWMTGYDKWKHAIGNRMLRPTSNPLTVESEEGRLAAKAWLYNHAGDTDFKAGGLIGLGVASYGNWQRIPKTEANDAAGVTNQYYVYRWGSSVDHAVTMVGWDDRIEFDLDGNGIAGEVSKDEKGAWIVVNSWGDWCNGGFIYCPYKCAGPSHDPETGALRGYWNGELYHARKNFRPLRTIKVKMDYSHRSELLLQVGVSTDLNATEPESVTDLHHFRYAGDGKNGNADPVPAIPMLGRWQGKLNNEPMEFMYDLTDFSANFDQNKPLKYFFIINRKKDTSLGSGNVYEAAIVDMESDLEGVESNFDLGGEKFEITQEGKRMILSTIVYGRGYNSINNLLLADGVLSWSEPNKGSYKVVSYNIYKDGILLGNTKETSYAVDGGRVYAVSAVYEDGVESEKVTCVASTVQNTVAANIENGGFVIPEVFKNTYKECTIEFWIKPTRFVNWNNQAGPGWGSYLQHFNADGTFTCGWNAPNDRVNSSDKFTLNAWQHVAIVVKDNKITIYRNAKSVGVVTSSSYSGIGGFGDFVFQYSNDDVWQNAQYDEIRIWNYARSVSQIRGSSVLAKKQEFHGDVLPQGLIAYYKGDTFQGEDGTYYMHECVNGYHAPIYGVADDPQADASSLKLVNTTLAAKLNIDAPENVYAGVPVTLTATRGDGINSMWWNIPACGVENKHIIAPTVVFAEPGTYEVSVSGLSYKGEEYNDVLQLEVKAAPELDATFSLNSESIPCGEHLSMHVNKYADACSYEWILPGATVENVVGPKAGATYEEAGEHTVTLKVTAADGRVSQTSQTIHVTNVAPKADFYVTEPVVMKGSPVSLRSTSRFTPTAYEWTLDGPAQKTTITEGQPVQTWTPQYPGRYSVGLKASNAIGDNEMVKERALIVTNAESGSGLNFSQPNAQVTIPLNRDLSGFTIDFWANPASLASSCWGIGNDENTLMLKVNSLGVMTVYIAGKYYTSPEGYVEAGMWNHYAIARNPSGTSTLKFMRNGEVVSTINSVTNSLIKATDMPNIILGVENAPLNGGIDEFRLWAGDRSNRMQELCNQPMENPEDENVALQVYYDFNQTSGDVIDRSGHGRNGVRTGFGPDGDAWGSSKGVFSLYFGEKQSDEVITGVDEVVSSEPVTAGRNGVYTLSGQYVGRSVKGLPAGLYIIDGKKVAVK